MPHIFPMVSPSGREKLSLTTSGRLSEVEMFMRLSLSNDVAYCFNHHTGENLDPSLHARTYEVIESKSLPVDLLVIIAAWWTVEREPHFEAIRAEIERTIASWPCQPEVEVHLNVIGKPAINLDKPICVHCAIEMQKAGSAFACPNCGATTTS